MDLAAFQAINYLGMNFAACCAVADSCVSKFITFTKGANCSSWNVVES